MPSAAQPLGQADGLRPPLSSNVEAVEKLSEPHLSRKACSMRTLLWIPAILCGGFFFRNKDYAVQLIDKDGNLQGGLFYLAFGIAAIIFGLLAATGKKSNSSSKDSPRELEKQDPPR